MATVLRALLSLRRLRASPSRLSFPRLALHILRRRCQAHRARCACRNVARGRLRADHITTDDVKSPLVALRRRRLAHAWIAAGDKLVLLPLMRTRQAMSHPAL